jgi:hypothetical protein
MTIRDERLYNTGNSLTRMYGKYRQYRQQQVAYEVSELLYSQLDLKNHRLVFIEL